LTVTFLWLV